MKIWPAMAAFTLVASTALAATTLSPVRELAGRYSRHWLNGTADGQSRFWSDDVLEIVPVDAAHAYVRLHVEFNNGHICGVSGVAETQGDALVYREPADKAMGGKRCTLRITRRGDKLDYTDTQTTNASDPNWASCSGYCGARGSLMKSDFAWSSRRPITYLDRLKASPQYTRALTEWHTGHMVKP